MSSLLSLNATHLSATSRPRTTRTRAATTTALSTASVGKHVQNHAMFPSGGVHQRALLQVTRGARGVATSRAGVVKTTCAVKKSFGSFDEMISGSDVPVLVDFYATWCGPCQLLAPELANIGAALRGRLTVVKIDTDKYPAIATKYNVEGLPTIVLFKKGEPVFRTEGMHTAQQLLPQLEYFLHDS